VSQAIPVNLLNWLLALSPIAVVLVLMLGFRWGGSKAGPVGWAVALVVAVLRYGAGLSLLAYAQFKAVLLSLYVLYIIWMALVLYHVVRETGAIEVIGQGITRLTGHRVLQLLLLAWVFSAFLQGVAGFGVPIAVVAPLLIGLGFAPAVSVSAVAIGHSWSVTFGDIASSFQALIAATGLPGLELAPWSAAFLGVACLGCGVGAAWVYGGLRATWQGGLALAVIGVVMAAVQAALAVSGLWNLAGFGAGLAGLAIGALVTRLRPYRVASTDAEPSDRPMSLWLALAPYLMLIVVVGAAELWPWLHGVLNEVQIRIRFPELQTSHGWTTPAGLGRTISVFGHAGALLAYVSLLSYLLYWRSGRYAAGAGRRIRDRTLKSAVPSSIGIVTMVGMAVSMDHSGMTFMLAQGISQVAGAAYPLVAPFIGLLGAFMTGSNTNSNVVFAPLQQQAATLLRISALVVLGGQTTGGALGSMLAPAKVIVGCSTAGLAGKEDQVMKRTVLPGLLIAGLVGGLAWLAIYVLAVGE
jgi:lactate permease